MRAHVQEIVFDCADPAALVRFWAGLLGGAPATAWDPVVGAELTEAAERIGA
ncbi:VOC family protein, partial [Streptomyces venezuelae]|uniref:VOC family protein n=1 Tax=Streptomyces venezuelae TaxID=54571 RepID=UPI003F4CB215